MPAAGARVVRPSGHDGWHSRRAANRGLDTAGFADVLNSFYAVKYSSALLRPVPRRGRFGAPAYGDRKSSSDGLRAASTKRIGEAGSGCGAGG